MQYYIKKFKFKIKYFSGLGPFKPEPELDIEWVLIKNRTRKAWPDKVGPEPDIFGLGTLFIGNTTRSLIG